MRETKTVCRYCCGACGMVARIDAADRLVSVRGDRDHPLTKGFACIRGLQATEAMYSPERILRPLKRQPDGSFREIDLETALDEIAAQVSAIRAESGGEAIAVFKGTQVWKNVTGHLMLNAFLPAIGSTRLFTTITIDQSAKQVTMRRMGYWNAGKHRLGDSDVQLIFGGNPLISVAVANFTYDPVKRLKDALKRGMKLIVADPRLTETAQHAHLFLQPRPGEDVALAAGLIRIILENDWHDAAFCAQYVEGFDRLRAAMAPFTADYVSGRTGVPASQLEAAAAMFARDSQTGIATAGTGPSMSPRSNLADHMIECLNVVCGRYYREGDRIPNPGVQNPRRAYLAEVVPPFREWETSPRTGTGHGALFGELMSGVLADEMLREDAGRIRALFVNAGNPAVALPQQEKAVAGLRNLDLLVAVEPFMTATARLADYVLPPRMMYERADTAITPHYESLIDEPFAQYTGPVVPPPPGAQLVDDWYPYWAIARRLGVTIDYCGVPLDMPEAPSTDDLLAITLRHSQVPFEEIKEQTGGHIFDVPPAWVERGTGSARFDVMPDDVFEELVEVRAEFLRPTEVSGGFTHLLTVRRLRGMMNSLGLALPEIRRRHPYNAAYLHPDDLAAMNLTDGAEIDVVSDVGRMPAIVECDATVRPGVLSISHCWGGLPDERLPYEAVGASTNLLVRTDRFVEAINAMPRLSSIPVRIEPRREQSADLAEISLII